MDKTCFITGIDANLYKEFKTACAYFDISIKDTIIKHMQNIVNDFNKLAYSGKLTVKSNKNAVENDPKK